MTTTMTQPATVIRALQGGKVEVDKPRRQVRAVVGSDRVDRYLTVIPPSGADIEEYLRNPVVLFEHGRSTHGSLPIGECLDFDIEKRRGMEVSVATIKFLEDDFSEQLWQRYASGEMRGWSVQMIPKPGHCGPPAREEVRARPELADFARAYQESEGKQGVIYRQYHIIGLSATALPGNADALTHSIERSLSGVSHSSSPWTSRERARDILNAQAFSHYETYLNLQAALRRAGRS